MEEKDRLIKNARLNIGYYLTNEEGQPFPNRTALMRARKRKRPQFSTGIEKRAPQEGDYTVVLVDRHCEKRDGDYPITRYGFYNGKWAFQYIVGYSTGKNEKGRKP